MLRKYKTKFYIKYIRQDILLNYYQPITRSVRSTENYQHHMVPALDQYHFLSWYNFVNSQHDISVIISSLLAKLFFPSFIFIIEVVSFIIDIFFPQNNLNKVSMYFAKKVISLFIFD